jgi:PqqD family protein of HPr-rel-A system
MNDPAPPTSAASRPRVREDIVFRPAGQEYVAYDPVSGQLHALNLTAALVWEMCDGAHSLDDMVREVTRTLQDAPPPDEVRRLLSETLRVFRDQGLLQ